MGITKKISIIVLSAFIGLFGAFPVYAAPENSADTKTSTVISEPSEKASETPISVMENSSDNSKANAIEKPDYSFSKNTIGNADLTAIEEILTDTGFYQFTAVTTRDGNVFYIIIDKSKDSDNVYFLNEVDTYDLKALISTKSGETVKVGENKENDADNDETSGDESETEKSEKSSGNTTFYLIVLVGIAVLGIIGFAVFKLSKGGFGKKNTQSEEILDDDFEDEDEINEDKE